MVKPSANDAEVAACLAGLIERAASAPLDDLGDVSAPILAEALSRYHRRKGADVFPLLERLLESGRDDLGEGAIEALGKIPDQRSARLLSAFVSGKKHDGLRGAARRALYRLGQAGVVLNAAEVRSRPFVGRPAERPVKSWSSGIDGSGSRALWLLVEDSYGALSLVTLVVNDQVGILDCAGGPISKKKLAQRLQEVTASQKLPWLECAPEIAISAIRDALAIHDAMNTPPPAAFSRWRPLLTRPASASSMIETGDSHDAALLDHSAELLDLPELGGWFVDPEAVRSEGLELLEARESRLVVNDQIKAEREAAIVDRAIDRIFTEEPRRLWAKRLSVMAWFFRETRREREAALAQATAHALDDPDKAPRHLPFVRQLVRRGLDLASEVVLGRVKREDVSRSPRSR